jgi:hypothetical protein
MWRSKIITPSSQHSLISFPTLLDSDKSLTLIYFWQFESFDIFKLVAFTIIQPPLGEKNNTVLLWFEIHHKLGSLNLGRSMAPGQSCEWGVEFNAN